MYRFSKKENVTCTFPITLCKATTRYLRKCRASCFFRSLEQRTTITRAVLSVLSEYRVHVLSTFSTVKILFKVLRNRDNNSFDDNF